MARQACQCCLLAFRVFPQVELEDAREIIREKRFHLVAAQRAEGALASHAQAVTAELKTTANELATLFGK